MPGGPQETVVILGGGIGGLSAAHELVERGYDVEVYEKRSIYGGKARSMPVPGTGTDEGERPLPGEHGFRFFPAFYRHIFDTMRRIPYEDNEEGVFDNLVKTTQWMIAREGEAELEMPLELPGMIEDWETVLGTLGGEDIKVPAEEQRFFADRLLTFLTSCEERREAEYEDLPWWEFIQPEGKTEGYKLFYGIGVTRGLVAMQAEKSSTRTIGRIYIQLLLGIAMPWLHADSVLDGPTSEVWIEPWVEYLQREGVTFHPNSLVQSFALDDADRISHVKLETPDGTQQVTGDHYIAAVPVEVMAELLTPELRAAAPSLADIDQLETAWMNGIQFYLSEHVPITQGHVIYEDSPWALTSISQQEFWETDVSAYGSGDVESIISLCISNWETPGDYVEKPAKECTPEEIKEEVWAQMTNRLNDVGQDRLDEDAIVTWHLDPDIEFPAPNETTNAEPLLINTVGSLQYRPDADLEVPNLFVAADYVRTHTDIATMEAANEAARRAVNAILEASRSDAERCDVWPLEEPAIFEPLKRYDQLRFDRGLPHRDAMATIQKED